jgi:acyl carrier protein
MEDSQTFEKVRDTIVKALTVDKDQVKMESQFIEDLGADSLDIVELLMQLEENFEINIPEEDQDKIRTVKDVVEYIDNSRK